MAGLNLVTGTGRQTVEELKKAIKKLDSEVINTLVGDVEELQTNMATAQGDITHLDTDYQALDARVGILENNPATTTYQIYGFNPGCNSSGQYRILNYGSSKDATQKFKYARFARTTINTKYDTAKVFHTKINLWVVPDNSYSEFGIDVSLPLSVVNFYITIDCFNSNLCVITLINADNNEIFSQFHLITNKEVKIGGYTYITFDSTFSSKITTPGGNTSKALY